MWLVLLCLTLSVAACMSEDGCTHCAMNTRRSHYSVVIVGAGASGVAAAAELLKNNFSDFLVLEGADRIGGRIYTAEFGDDIIEYGAQFVHGEEGNSVFQMANPENLLVSYSRYQNASYFYNSSGPVETEFVKKLLDTCENILYRTNVSEYNGTVMDVLVTRYKEFVCEQGIDPVIANSVFEICVKHENSYDGTDSLSQIGPRALTEYWECKGDLSLSWAKHGYRTVFDLLTGKYPHPENELPVVNNTVFRKHVTAIDWSADTVKLTCADGTEYTADYVVVTSSLGYLKKHYKTLFSPELPTNKAAAIQSLGFGTVNKIFLQFAEAWWDNNTFAFEFVWSDGDKEAFYNSTSYGKWPVDVIGFFFVENQPHVLCAWISGSAAREMEMKNDTDVINASMDLLRRFLGDHYSIPEPEAMRRSAWWTNPFASGSYSFLSLESEKLNVSAADLADPLLKESNRTGLMFAGEATHSHYFSTVHGAIDTGRREANRVLNLVNGKK